MRWTATGLRTALRWSLRIASALVLLVLVVNIGLVLALFGVTEGAGRIVGDWRRIAIAHEMGERRLSPGEAFQRAYGGELGASPASEEIRAYVARDLETGEPAIFDVILARYILTKFGAIDGRTLPPGVYLAAGPIGPDRWPGPLATQYLVFPRHGYLLVVPPKRGDTWPAAYEATASLRKEFRRTKDPGALYAAVQQYRPGAYDFPTPGEPLHDLLLVSQRTEEIAQIEEQLTAFSRKLDAEGLGYRLLRRNSNSALACYLNAVGLSSRVSRYVDFRWLLRIRLPGIRGAQNLPC